MIPDFSLCAVPTLNMKDLINIAHHIDIGMDIGIDINMQNDLTLKFVGFIIPNENKNVKRSQKHRLISLSPSCQLVFLCSCGVSTDTKILHWQELKQL